jgi:hypothetical protein
MFAHLTDHEPTRRNKHRDSTRGNIGSESTAEKKKKKKKKLKIKMQQRMNLLLLHCVHAENEEQ